MMTKEEAKALILKYNAGQCTAQEEHLVESWYRYFAEDEEIGLSNADFQQLRDEMWAAMPAEFAGSKTYRLWPRLVAAAVVILVAGVSLWFGSRLIESFQQSEAVQYVNNIPPGKNTATITLSDGKRIALSEGKSGVVIDARKLTYNDGSVIASNRPGNSGGMQTVTTPKGGTYQVVLPDGTKVQLNAASSIKFASDFELLAVRKVELEGEAYFEVSKNKEHPFVVKSKNQQIKVLGTHFNVSAYSDEQNTKTTLLEGAIQINDQLLKPNQQAIQFNGKINIREVNANDAVDWKNGEFICKNEPLEGIMKKIARWYDVDVEYANPQLRNITFSGSLSRYDHVVDVLKALGFAGTMKFKLEDRKIQVL